MMNWSFWLELFARSAALLICGEALRRFSKAQSAAFRHKLLLSAFVLLALLPVLAVLFPEIPISLWGSIRSPQALVTVQEVSSTMVETAGRHQMNWPFIGWLMGVLLASGPLLAGSVSAWRMVRRATPLTTRAVPDALSSLSPLLSSKAEILLSSELSIPLTCGVFRPRILLPAEAEEWSSFRLRAVLLHELAHVRRRDVAAQVAAHLIAALWWFQPLVWLLRRTLRAESELACDAEALRSGFRSSEYAAELLALAKSIGGSRLSSAALSMVRSRDLEKRLRAILNPPPASLPASRTFVFALALGGIAIAASAVTLYPNQTLNQRGASTMKRTILSALLTSAGLSAATVSGTIHDPNGAPVSGAKVLVYNPDTGAKQETATDANGKFSVDGSSASEYILRVEKPGFSSIFLDAKSDSKMDRVLTMTIEGVEQLAQKDEDQPRGLRIGGLVAQSNLTTKVQPIYPAAAKAARTQGTVEIETTISKDGVPIELRVLSSPSDDLSEASLEAVRQWRYRPTLLNGAPVEVVTDVIVNYTLAQ